MLDNRATVAVRAAAASRKPLRDLFYIPLTIETAACMPTIVSDLILSLLVLGSRK
jgi:hypothetical protein